MKILLHQFNEYYIVKYEILKEIIDRGDYNINIYDGRHWNNELNTWENYNE